MGHGKNMNSLSIGSYWLQCAGKAGEAKMTLFLSLTLRMSLSGINDEHLQRKGKTEKKGIEPP